MALMLIDTSAVIWPSYHVNPTMTTKDGTPIGAVHGYCMALIKHLRGQTDVTHLGAVFDAARRSFRHDIYPEYKATRRETPEALQPQFELIRRATMAMGFPIVESEGYEADDLLASYAEGGKTQGMQVEIVGVDKDLFQLLDGEMVHMWCPRTKALVRRDDVIEKFGVGPELAIEAQALIGDRTDNIPGVKGIGKAIAGKLIREFGSLDGVLTNVANIKPNSARASLLLPANQKAARLSKELVTLKRDVPLPIPIERLGFRGIDMPGVLAFAESIGMISLLDAVEGQPA
jgi:DNA polymerase-1